MSKIIGIDLGTTNSCVAVLDERGPRVLASPEGERTTPSVVSWAPSGEVLVGVPARRQAVTNAPQTVFGAKRLVGRKVNSDDVTALAKTAPYRIVAASNGDAWVKIAGAPRSPQEIASHVLRRMRAIAEAALGEAVTRAVVTVPAYFDEHQRQATRDAGTIAGLDIVRILNEPTAAALAYGAHRISDRRRTLAVFDLGGGTFDISIMSVDGGIFEVLATGGDSALGGEDWDRRMVERVADDLFDQHRVDLLQNPVALGRLREACETAKKQLSGEREAWLRLPFVAQDQNGNPVNVERKMTRDEVERWTKDLLDKLGPPCKRTFADAGLTPSDIEEVILVGGMTRWPAVQQVVEQIFGKKPSKNVNPDEVVAMGAAAYAGILGGETDDATLLDVTPHDLGIKVGESGFSVLIPRNSMLPVRVRKLFATTMPDQKFVSIELYQGEHADVRKNRRLGQVVLDGLPPGQSGSVRVELVLTIDVESIMSVTARELSTGKEAGVTLRPTGGLSQKEIVEIISRRRDEENANAAAPHPGLEGSVSRVPTREMPRVPRDDNEKPEKP
ncbi:MAG TPA: Hsp70 family protein [Kofleriaceae bacterium]|nr:Hsp70 family protein [Kofleriaceae bacterium]